MERRRAHGMLWGNADEPRVAQPPGMGRLGHTKPFPQPPALLSPLQAQAP